MASMSLGRARAGVLASLWGLCALGGGLAPAGALGAPAGLRFSFEALDLPGYNDEAPAGLNNKGEVLVNAGNNPYNFRPNPSIYSKGTFTSVADRFRYLEGINDRGDLIGASVSGLGHFLWRDGQMINLATTFPGLTADVRGAALGINNKGWVTGTMQPTSDARGQVFVYDGQTSRFLDMPRNFFSLAWDINEHGAVAGQLFPPGYNDEEFIGFMHDGTTATVLPTFGGKYGQAFAINDAGQVVGEAYGLEADSGGFLYSGGVLTRLADVDIAKDINNRGWIVGNGSREVHPEAVLVRNGKLLYLRDLIPDDVAAQWRLDDATAINERGQIIGSARSLVSGLTLPFLLTPVPDAPTWALLLAGLGVVGAAARRRGKGPEAGATPAPC